jgi:uncharacterized protein with FMN-binding domain
MFKHRVLATVGFTLGAAIVLISLPPTLLNPPETFKEPTEPAPSSSTQGPSQSPSPSVTPSATSTESSIPKTTSRTIIGNIVPAGQYGDVQVQIVVTNGIITASKALIYPDGDARSSSISALAIPILIEQTLTAVDNANIQGVSQASYTTAAWKSSLQSALDKR